jgi:hypothetical protein
MRHWYNFIDIMRNTDNPFMRYAKMYALSFSSAVVPTLVLAEFIPGFSTLAKHKGIMSGNFHNPTVFFEGARYHITK